MWVKVSNTDDAAVLSISALSNADLAEFTRECIRNLRSRGYTVVYDPYDGDNEEDEAELVVFRTTKETL